MAIREAKRINQSKSANKVTGTMRLDSRFMDLMKKILNLSIAFEKKYN